MLKNSTNACTCFYITDMKDRAKKAVRMYCNNESHPDILDVGLLKCLSEEEKVSLFTEKHNGMTIVQTAARRANSGVIRRILTSVCPASRIKLIQVSKLFTSYCTCI